MSNTITIRQPGTGGHRSTSAGEIWRGFFTRFKKKIRGNEDSKEFEVVFFLGLENTCFNPKNLHLKHAQNIFLNKKIALKITWSEGSGQIYNSRLLHQTKETNQAHQGTNTRISDPRTKILCGNLKAPPPSGSLLWGNGCFFFCLRLFGEGFKIKNGCNKMGSKSKRLGVNFAMIWPVKLKVIFPPKERGQLVSRSLFWRSTTFGEFSFRKIFFHQLNWPSCIETWDIFCIIRTWYIPYL